MTHAARLALNLLISSIDVACDILVLEGRMFDGLRMELGAIRITLKNLKRDLEYPEVE